VRNWTWWQGGVALGLLSTLAMIVLKPMGVSTFFPSSLGIVLRPLFPHFVEGNAYFQTVPLSIGWEHMLVLGIPLGAFLAYKLSGEQPSREPGTDLATTSPLLAFAGGFLVLFGARMAGGCTTGHVLSGMSQLSVAGFLFAAAIFAGGIPAALLLKRRWS
uniref:YeeE/YedE thiosulfate transporter family protein n=1 Tax=Symbiobacterium terraclitae TaxID=557451 RepID=UPI0035B5208B